MPAPTTTGPSRRAPVAVAAVVAALALALALVAARPASSQEVPSLSDLIEQIGDIEGLDPLDPVLNPVFEIITALEEALGEGGAPGAVNAFQLEGDDAVSAAVAFSQATFPDGAAAAVVGREDLFADSMSSSGFQGVFDAPLLLTDSGDLDPRTGNELQRLGMDTVTILGGEDALDPVVVNKLEIAGLEVVRVGGATRVETSTEAADLTNGGATRAVLVRAYPDPGEPDSQAYADLLAAGPYAADSGWPVLMTTSAELHPAVAEELATFDEVTIIGGTGAIAASVADELEGMGLTVDRIAGDNRFATAVAIAEERGFTSSADADQIVLAESGGRDDVWAPGFAATSYADQNTAPVLLSDGELLPQETLAFLAQGVPENLLDGGPAIVCAPFVSEPACLAAGALSIGALSDLGDILGLPLEDIPLIGDILEALSEAGLLPEQLQEVVDALLEGGVSPDAVADLVEALAGGDAEAVTDVLEDVPLIGDIVGGLGGGDGDDDDGGGGSNPVTDLIEDLIGGLGGGL
ncbi:cell wall-binding repeat-containing protein [Euzebya sp.]|uniref:cell wall-binding repeat-containing protein n=1 Tax=Euzebya sp. TaxID=1971409 RepID=UPI003514A97A